LRSRAAIDDGVRNGRAIPRLEPDDTHAQKVQTLRNAKIAVTRIRCDESSSGETQPIVSEKSFIISVQLKELASHEIWSGGQRVFSGRYPGQGVSAFDLREDPRLHISTPFDCLQFHVTRATLNAVADECGARRIETLSWPHGTMDPTVRHLGSALLPALDSPETASGLFLDHIALALNTHFACVYGGMRALTPMARGGLAAWQERRCKEMIEARFAEQISLDQLAGECRLSSSHFARAFRKSTGESPHRWLVRRRVEAAKTMLSSSEMAISEIALACGFVDQSHLTRVFSSLVGAPPGAWRSSRRN
jgi:AraC-like DNA-binding protein